MAIKGFDSKFQNYLTQLVEVAFEYVGFFKAEVETIYIYGSMEDGEFFYNVFYRINGALVENHKINEHVNKKIDDSDERSFGILRLGTKILKEVARLFKEDNREIPTLMKMIFYPKSRKFDNSISYDLYYSNHPERTNVNGFEEWFEEVAKGTGL